MSNHLLGESGGNRLGAVEGVRNRGFTMEGECYKNKHGNTRMSLSPKYGCQTVQFAVREEVVSGFTRSGDCGRIGEIGCGLPARELSF